MAKRIKMVKYLDAYPPSDHDIRPVDKGRIREIAQIMLDSYIGTPDYEGETLHDTIKEIAMVFRGTYGEFLEDASFIALDEDEAIAACLFMCNFKNEPTLTYMFTCKACRHQGYATSLIQAAETALLELGHDRIFLFVSEDNEEALRLYRHQGFMAIPLNSSTIDREFLKEVREWELNYIPIDDEAKLAKIIDHEFEKPVKRT